MGNSYSSRSQPVLAQSAIGHSGISAALTKAQVLRKLKAGTLTMAEYLSYARAQFSRQFRESEAAPKASPHRSLTRSGRNPK